MKDMWKAPQPLMGKTKNMFQSAIHTIPPRSKLETQPNPGTLRRLRLHTFCPDPFFGHVPPNRPDTFRATSRLNRRPASGAVRCETRRRPRNSTYGGSLSARSMEKISAARTSGTTRGVHRDRHGREKLLIPGEAS